MDEEKRLRIGGVTLGVRSGAPGLRLELDQEMERFLTEDAETAADLQLTVTWDQLTPEVPGPPVFDSGGPWRLFRAGADLLFRFTASDRGEVPFAEVRVRPDLSSGEVRLHRPFHFGEDPVDALPYPLDEVLFIHLLSERRGIELHACGIRMASGGLLFAGQSGDGKTTTARLWQAARPNATILSDDRIIVRLEDGEVYIYGTPWHGEAKLAANLRVPLRAILVLERGVENRLIPLAPVEAVALLLARAFPPFHSGTAMANALQLLADVVERVPCYRFPFMPGAGAPGAAGALLEVA